MVGEYESHVPRIVEGDGNRCARRAWHEPSAEDLGWVPIQGQRSLVESDIGRGEVRKLCRHRAINRSSSGILVADGREELVRPPVESRRREAQFSSRSLDEIGSRREGDCRTGQGHCRGGGLPTGVQGDNGERVRPGRQDHLREVPARRIDRVDRLTVHCDQGNLTERISWAGDSTDHDRLSSLVGAAVSRGVDGHCWWCAGEAPGHGRGVGESICCRRDGVGPDDCTGIGKHGQTGRIGERESGSGIGACHRKIDPYPCDRIAGRIEDRRGQWDRHTSQPGSNLRGQTEGCDRVDRSVCRPSGVRVHIIQPLPIDCHPERGGGGEGVRSGLSLHLRIGILRARDGLELNCRYQDTVNGERSSRVCRNGNIEILNSECWLIN